MDLCFCPYCVQPVDPGAVSCPVCFERLGNDALVEMDAREWIAQRRPCPRCFKAVHPMTVRCAFCNELCGGVS